jgi:hypothetical protein
VQRQPPAGRSEVVGQSDHVRSVDDLATRAWRRASHFDEVALFALASPCVQRVVLEHVEPQLLDAQLRLSTVLHQPLGDAPRLLVAGVQ